MRMFDLKYLYSAGAAAALTAAAIAIPAWASSGGGQDDQSGAQSSAPVPMPPPAGAFFARGEDGAASAAEARKRLDELTDCMRENGIDVPHTSTKGGGFSIQVPPPEARSAMKRAAEQCGLPAPPARDHLAPLRPTLSTQGSTRLKGLSHCLGAKSKDLPVPVPPPARPSK
jgi:hypothetical protein